MNFICDNSNIFIRNDNTICISILNNVVTNKKKQNKNQKMNGNLNTIKYPNLNGIPTNKNFLSTGSYTSNNNNIDYNNNRNQCTSTPPKTNINVIILNKKNLPKQNCKLTNTFLNQHNMKYRIPTGNHSFFSNRIRSHFINELLTRNHKSIYRCVFDHERNRNRLHNANFTHKHGISILPSNIFTHSPGAVFFISFKPTKNMNVRYNTYNINNSYSLSRICSTLRANVFLRGHSNYRNNLSNSNSRNKNRNMNLRRSFSSSTNTKSIFLPSLRDTHVDNSSVNNPSDLSTRKRIFKPNKNLDKLR